MSQFLEVGLYHCDKCFCSLNILQKHWLWRERVLPAGRKDDGFKVKGLFWAWLACMGVPDSGLQPGCPLVWRQPWPPDRMLRCRWHTPQEAHVSWPHMACPWENREADNTGHWCLSTFLPMLASLPCGQLVSQGFTSHSKALASQGSHCGNPLSPAYPGPHARHFWSDSCLEW